MKQVVDIPFYIREVQLSQARRVKYYEEGGKLPKAAKWHDRTKYAYRIHTNNKSYLTDLKTGERVIANPKAAGTPSFAKINGQGIYNGDIAEHVRAKVMQAIKAQITPFIKQFVPPKPEEYPIRVTVEVHDERQAPPREWDLDNRALPYVKGIQDAIKREGIIVDDNINYITEVLVRYVEAPAEKRKLVVMLESINQKI